MWSFSPMMLRNGTVMSARWMSRPPSGIVPVSSRFWRFMRSAIWRNAAPGNGMWSRPHCVITWWAATNSSFQRCCHRLT